MDGLSYLDGLAASKEAETFGQRCRRKRIEQQVGLGVLADAVGLSKETLTKLETEDRLVEVETLRKIADYLQLGRGNMAELIGNSLDKTDRRGNGLARAEAMLKPSPQNKLSVAELKARNNDPAELRARELALPPVADEPPASEDSTDELPSPSADSTESL
jgi:transcriptional regulator with XRE-family HTH domain